MDRAYIRDNYCNNEVLLDYIEQLQGGIENCTCSFSYPVNIKELLLLKAITELVPDDYSVTKVFETGDIVIRKRNDD